MTTGDIIGWTLFWIGIVLVPGLLIALIYFLISSAMRPKDRLEYALAKIAALDIEIERQKNRHSKYVTKLIQEREKWKQQAQEYSKLRDELEAKGIIDPKPEIPVLIAAIGSDEALDTDLTALRSVRSTTGMQFVRVQDATLAKLKTVLDRERANGHRCNLHLAVHSGAKGIELGGVLVDATALSEILDGVQVMVIAGCESGDVADLLGVVPFVVSFTEQISHADARTFSRIFWQGIGNRMEPEKALSEALRRSPANLSEFITQH